MCFALFTALVACAGVRLAAADTTWVDLAPGDLPAPVQATLQHFVGASVLEQSGMPIAPVLATLQTPVAIMDLPHMNRVIEANGRVYFTTAVYGYGTYNSIEITTDGRLVSVFNLHC